MFAALYTPMIYRRKKVKSFKEGFIERREKKLVLLDEGKHVIDSQFSSMILEEGVEIDFDHNYCLVGEVASQNQGNIGQLKQVTAAPILAKRRIGLKKSSVSICGPINPPIAENASKDSHSGHGRNDDREVPQKTMVKKSRLSIRNVELFQKLNSNENRTCQESIISEPLSQERNTASVVLKPKTDQDLLAFFLDDEKEVYEREEEGKMSWNDNTNEIKQNCRVELDHIRDELLVENDLQSNSDDNSKNLPVPPPHPVSSVLSRKPLLSKFNRPAVIPPPLESKNSIKNTNSRPHSQKENTMLSRKYPSRPNLFNLVFEPSSTIQKKSDKYPLRLYRQTCIPDRFPSIQEYQKKLQASVIECMNLELADLYYKFEKMPQKREHELRNQNISFYANVSLKNAYSYSTNERSNLLLSVGNKEHHSAYSKDDIWMVSDHFSMRNPEFFRSFYYGASGDALELIPLSSSTYPCSTWLESGTTSLYALRAFNANSECMMLDMLGSEAFQETPLVKNLFSKPPVLIRGESQPKSTDLILKEHLRDFEYLYKNMIEKFKLNQEQAKVILSFCQCLSGQNPCPIVLAHGVYGAGKSFLIAVLILILEKANQSRLFTIPHVQIVFASMTNVAVDRILLSLLDLGFHDFIRVGSLKKIAKPILAYTASKSNQNDLKELNEMLMESENEDEKRELEAAISRFRNSNQNTTTLLSETFLIGITCLATNFDLLEGISCPIVILDECSQMTEPMSLLPIVRFQSQYALLVGDPKQLAPTLLHSLDPQLKKQNGLERTLFERLSDCQICKPILLSQQYRCHPQISMLSNRLFYQSQLRDGENVEKKKTRMVPDLGPLSFVRVQGEESKSSHGSFKNDTEMNVIICVISCLINKGISGDQFGVISLYKHQSDLISTTLKSKGIEKVQSATVDSFQGSEKEIILVSTVRSTTSSFLEDPRRINVALTRAKRHLIILACDGMANGSKLWRKVQEFCSDANPGIITSQNFLSLLS